MATATTVLNLECARKRNGVSLEAIAESTKISSRFLRAIESEEFEKLPGGVFNTSYIRQYAAAIGYSEQQILSVYCARMEPAESGNSLRRSSRPAPRPARLAVESLPRPFLVLSTQSARPELWESVAPRE